MEKILKGENITKTFGIGNEKQIVLNDISIEINKGEFISIMGPSGSGKTTLMYALSGMDSIDSGNVFFNGKKLTGLKEKELADLRRIKMGFVFQQPALLKNLNIFDNIILRMMKDNKKNAKKIKEKAKKLMTITGISGIENRSIIEVSGGQLQRAGICMELMNEPEIIFGDEPTGALNSGTAEEIMNLFSDINSQGTAIMLVTHDAKVAARTERIMFMKDGKIVEEMRMTKEHEDNLIERTMKVTQKMREIGI